MTSLPTLLAVMSAAHAANRLPPRHIPPAAVSVCDAAKNMSIGKTSAYALIRSGALISFKIGRKRLILTSSIDAFIAQQCAAENPVAYDDNR